MPRSTVGQRPVALGSLLLLVLWCPLVECYAADGQAGPPLHERIDRLIAGQTADFDRLAAPPASDAEFLRRVSLDLTGSIPTAAQARAFLDDNNPLKREACIDRLLASGEYARRMQRVVDVILMRRLPAANVKAAEWEEYLRTAFAENRPWDQITREVLSADGTDAANRGPARFYLDRNGDVDEITRDVARIFLGARLGCAQCHDHPEIDEWKQEHYYGISAFLVRSFVFTGKDKTAVLAEKAEGEVSFESVFEIRDKISKGPRSVKPAIFSGPALDEPQFSGDEAYEVKPADGVRPIPKFSRLARLADAITSPDNRRFARTSANRLWALLMGRGLVHPVDYDYSDNPPSHPELLDELTDAFIASGYDVRRLLREITLSQTYQRSSRLSEDSREREVPEESFAQAIIKPLSPSQLAWAVLEATGEAGRQRLALGDQLSEKSLYEKLAGHEAGFVKLFGGVPGKLQEEFQSTVEQALFLANDPGVVELTQVKDGNLADRLLKISADETESLAEELFLCVLTRRPDSDEMRDVDLCLMETTGETRPAAIGELIWALVTSSEFRFNH